MFGMRHSSGSPFEGKVGGAPRLARAFRSRMGRRAARLGGGGDMMRAGRMLAQGDLRLIALALIAEQPRHGYEIIKVLEEKTAGWYSPSPGIVYPTLTYLEEAGYVTAGDRGRKEALHHHYGGPRPSRREPRFRRRRAGASGRHRRARGAHAPALRRRGRRSPRPQDLAAGARSDRESARGRGQAASRTTPRPSQAGRGAGARRAEIGVAEKVDYHRPRRRTIQYSPAFAITRRLRLSLLRGGMGKYEPSLESMQIARFSAHAWFAAMTSAAAPAPGGTNQESGAYARGAGRASREEPTERPATRLAGGGQRQTGKGSVARPSTASLAQTKHRGALPRGKVKAVSGQASRQPWLMATHRRTPPPNSPVIGKPPHAVAVRGARPCHERRSRRSTRPQKDRA